MLPVYKYCFILPVWKKAKDNRTSQNNKYDFNIFQISIFFHFHLLLNWHRHCLLSRKEHNQSRRGYPWHATNPKNRLKKAFVLKTTFNAVRFVTVTFKTTASSISNAKYPINHNAYTLTLFKFRIWVLPLSCLYHSVFTYDSVLKNVKSLKEI